MGSVLHGKLGLKSCPSSMKGVIFPFFTRDPGACDVHVPVCDVDALGPGAGPLRSIVTLTSSLGPHPRSIPREWHSQKAVKIISVQPSPHAEYEDPEHGNKMFYWDFGKLPARSTYQVSLKYRFEALVTHPEIDPKNIGEYSLSTCMVSPKLWF
jgi:hypothetical protein